MKKSKKLLGYLSENKYSIIVSVLALFVLVSVFSLAKQMTNLSASVTRIAQMGSSMGGGMGGNYGPSGDTMNSGMTGDKMQGGMMGGSQDSFGGSSSGRSKGGNTNNFGPFNNSGMGEKGMNKGEMMNKGMNDGMGGNYGPSDDEMNKGYMDNYGSSGDMMNKGMRGGSGGGMGGDMMKGGMSKGGFGDSQGGGMGGMRGGSQDSFGGSSSGRSKGGNTSNFGPSGDMSKGIMGGSNGDMGDGMFGGMGKKGMNKGEMMNKGGNGYNSFGEDMGNGMKNDKNMFKGMDKGGSFNMFGSNQQQQKPIDSAKLLKNQEKGAKLIASAITKNATNLKKAKTDARKLTALVSGLKKLLPLCRYVDLLPQTSRQLPPDLDFFEISGGREDCESLISDELDILNDLKPLSRSKDEEDKAEFATGLQETLEKNMGQEITDMYNTFIESAKTLIEDYNIALEEEQAAAEDEYSDEEGYYGEEY